jgi:hypothetical protein
MGTEGVPVSVIVGIKVREGVARENVGNPADGLCPAWVSAREVKVASTSTGGVGVTEGRLHAKAVIIRILNMNIMPLCFCIVTSMH